MNRWVALLLTAMSFTAYANQPAEPDEGGMGGTGNGVEHVSLPAGMERPDVPERVEVPDLPGTDLPDINMGTEGMGGDLATPPDIPERPRPGRD